MELGFVYVWLESDHIISLAYADEDGNAMIGATLAWSIKTESGTDLASGSATGDGFGNYAIQILASMNIPAGYHVLKVNDNANKFTAVGTAIAGFRSI